MQLLAISGSLRARSSNTEVLRALALVAPPGVTITHYDGLADLPAFNPDVEETTVPSVVADLRAAVDRSDALVLSSPEYAHGVAGSLKNALDWLVGQGRARKPIALLNTSQTATIAHAALAEILTTMDGVVLPSASLRVVTGPRDAAAIAADPTLSAQLRRTLAALLAAVAADP